MPLFALLTCLMASTAGAETASFSPPRTLGDFVDFLNDKADAAQTAGDASGKAGDYALTQQQYLLRDMIKKSANEYKFLKRTILPNAIDDLDAAARSRFDDIVKTLGKNGASDQGEVMKTVREAQTEFNALFRAELKAAPHPILYGTLSRDLADGAAPPSADVEIFGFDIIDTDLQKAPVVQIGATDLPPDAVAVKDDDIFVTLPAGVRAAVGFAPDPCQGRSTFPLRVTTYYGESRGVWPLSWVEEHLSNADFSVLPTPTAYDLSIAYNFERVTHSEATETYSQRSPYVVADCDQTVSTSVVFDVPAGARDITCEANWAETVAVKSANGSCAIKGETIEANGAISGPEKVCSALKLCGCVANARGWLEVSGSYKKGSQRVESISASPPNRYPLLPDTAIAIPLNLDAGARLTHIGVIVAKRACPTHFDKLDIGFANDGAQIVAGISKTGAFRAKLKNNRLIVGEGNFETPPAATSN